MSMARSDTCTAKAWAILVIVFLGGVASGVLGTRAMTPQRAPGQPANTEIAVMDSDTAVEHLVAELNLSQDQTQQVRGILDECIMEEADLLRRIQSIKAEGRERIAKVLDEPQRSKFKAMLLQASTK